MRGFLAVAFNFGFRKSELLGLSVKQVSLKDRTAQLLPGTTKNDKGRTVLMTEDVYQRLSPCVKNKQPDDALFTWEDGSPGQGLSSGVEQNVQPGESSRFASRLSPFCDS